MEIEVAMEGLKQLEKVLDTLPSGVGRTRMRQALKKTAKVGVDAAKAELRAGWWESESSVRTVSARVESGIKSGDAEVYVTAGPKRYFATLYESGTKYLKAAPWLIPAFESSKETMVSVFTKNVLDNLEKYANNVLKKAYSGKLSRQMIKSLGL